MSGDARVRDLVIAYRRRESLEMESVSRRKYSFRIYLKQYSMPLYSLWTLDASKASFEWILRW